MKIVQIVNVKNSQNEGVFGGYYGLEFGLLRIKDRVGAIIDFNDDRENYSVPAKEYKLITGDK
jgi:hypothetical protein